MAITKIEHVGIYVTALEDSIEFYERVIGLRHLHTIGEVGEDIRLAFLTFPGQESVEVELIWKAKASDLAKEGRVHHIAFTVSGIKKEYARIADLGLSGLSPEILSLATGGRFFFFNGPDGERIEFFEPLHLV
ncbi:lactoylglutathione lyase [Fontibacillus panacisegetis]|uniref:Lactoylglutathione lyase n=1 Tax=Fontibacillus panacisegetis TaxID=670482 RepID=A0A1G7PFY5_9BACL|nr:VOC family protein [Fontibacillus panacisegetis]SDF85108.1 lactoylglutathione lyase [Fontibacillus panacisegetis]